MGWGGDRQKENCPMGGDSNWGTPHLMGATSTARPPTEGCGTLCGQDPTALSWGPEKTLKPEPGLKPDLGLG